MSTEELVCDAIARKDEGAAQKALTRAEETSRVAFDSALVALFIADASPAFVASVLRPMLNRLTLSAEHWQLVAEGGVRLGNNAIRDLALARGKSASTRPAHAKAAKR